MVTDRSASPGPPPPALASADPVPSAGLPLAAPDDLLAGRYRLLCAVPVPPDAPAVLWQARDEVLARQVAVRLLPVRSRLSAGLLEAAVRVGAAQSPSLVRLYDAAVEPRRGSPSLVYVLSEWVDGDPLAAVLGPGPLPVGAALAAGEQAAAAVAALHAAGVAHGRLHPGNVLVSGDGRLRLTDAEVAAALRRPADRADPAADVRGVGALLYALLTARWPLVDAQPAPGLPPAPQGVGGPSRPRQVLAGVPRELDELVMRLLRAPAGEQLCAADMLAALQQARAGQPRSTGPPSGRPAALRLRRHRRR